MKLMHILHYTFRFYNCPIRDQMDAKICPGGSAKFCKSKSKSIWKISNPSDIYYSENWERFFDLILRPSLPLHCVLFNPLMGLTSLMPLKGHLDIPSGPLHHPLR